MLVFKLLGAERGHRERNILDILGIGFFRRGHDNLVKPADRSGLRIGVALGIGARNADTSQRARAQH